MRKTPITTKLNMTPSRKMAAKSHLNLERQESGVVGEGRGAGVFSSAVVCGIEALACRLLLKTGSRFIK
jgi:hypothetical protein